MSFSSGQRPGRHRRKASAEAQVKLVDTESPRVQQETAGLVLGPGLRAGGAGWSKPGGWRRRWS